MNVQGGQLIQSNGNPIFPATQLTGPITAGNIKDWDGSATLAGLGSTAGALANVGYARMSQAGRITQAAAPGFVSPDLVIPAQSLILGMTLIGLVAFTGTVALGVAGNPGFFTGGAALAAPPLGFDPVPPPTAQPYIGNWLNVGNQDVQVVALASAAGAGVGILVVDYLQGINAATS